MARVRTRALRAALAAVSACAALLAVLQPAIRIPAVAAAAALLVAHYLLTAARPPTLHYRRTALAEEVVAGCPSLGRRFWPTPWCFNGHLQAALMSWRDAHEPPLRFDRSERLRMEDGGLVSLRWLGADRAARGAPVLVVLPTLCGDAQSLRGFAREMSARLGWCVVVLDRRGHGDLPLTTPRFHLLGSADDLRMQLRHLRERLPSSPLYAVGLSAGSGLLVRYLGEEGARSLVAAGVAFCPGYDTTRAFTRVHRGYDRYLVRMLREHFLERHRAALESVDGFAETLASRSVAEFQERGFRLFGYGSAAEYHRGTNPMEVMRDVRVPLMVLNAEDDPVCVVQNLRDHLAAVASIPETLVVLTARGSHCAFFEGVIRPSSWACRAMAEYLGAVHAALSQRADAATRDAVLPAAVGSA